MSRQDYSLAQVAALVLLCGELYMRAHRPKSPSADPTRGTVKVRTKRCRECQAKFESYSEDTCDPCRLKRQAPAVHADVLERLRLAGSDWENLAIALSDLDLAMRRISSPHRDGIGQFVELGPLAIEEDYVQFRVGHAPHVLALWRSVNRLGEFSQEEPNANVA